MDIKKELLEKLERKVLEYEAKYGWEEQYSFSGKPKDIRDALALAAKIGMKNEEQRRLVQYKNENLLDTAAYIIADAIIASQEQEKSDEK